VRGRTATRKHFSHTDLSASSRFRPGFRRTFAQKNDNFIIGTFVAHHDFLKGALINYNLKTFVIELFHNRRRLHQSLAYQTPIKYDSTSEGA